MILKYLKKLRPILNKVGQKHMIPISEGEFILNSFFESFRDAITDPRIPRVKFPNIGNFHPRLPRIYDSLKRSIRYYRKGGLTREYINARIRRIWPVRNRLFSESKGEITWKEWKSKDMYEKMKNLVDNEQEERKKSTEKIFRSSDNPPKSRDFLG